MKIANKHLIIINEALNTVQVAEYFINKNNSTDKPEDNLIWAKDGLRAIAVLNSYGIEPDASNGALFKYWELKLSKVELV
jgi:hypothetical protein